MKPIPLLLAVCIAQAAELPVREVILYKHGVGFFSRSGELKPGETARLDFKSTDMDDVLKSLTVEERGGGKVVGLRYDSSEPLEKKLEQFPFGLGEHFALSGVLDQMTGARIEFRYGADPITGQIVSARETADKDKAKEQLVLLLDNGEIRTLDLGAAQGIRFLDPVLQRQFSDYLRIVGRSRTKEKRSVYLDSTSAAAGARSLTANYMIPSAVWKSSYRLIFGNNTGATLEGWAIVDNTTDEDWSNVRLALVSGKPISFISALYGPKYRARSNVQLPEDSSEEPVLYEGAVESPKSIRMFSMEGVPGGVPVGAAGGVIGGIMGGVPSAAPPPPPPPRRVQISNSTVNVDTQGAERGDLFEYRFDSPVTVKKSESAMLPFLQQKLSSRKLLVYQEYLGQNPRSAAELTNSTGKTLDGGPITVYDDGVYAGEALVATFKAGDKRLISYAVDLGTRVSTKLDSGDAQIRLITASRGELHTRFATLATKTYTIHNVDAKAKTMLIEQIIRSEYRLLSPTPAETTSTAYRFEVKLDPKSTSTYVIKEENLYEDSYRVSNLTPAVLATYVSNYSLSPAARLQLANIADRKQRIFDADAEINGLDQESRDLTHQQDRLRENIRTLNAVAGQQEQVQKYARQLAEGDTKLAALADLLKETRQRKQVLESDVSSLIEKLQF